MCYEASPGRHGPIRRGERIGLGVGLAVLVLMIAISAKAQDIGPVDVDDQSVSAQPSQSQSSPSSVTVNVDSGADSGDGWAAVRSAVQDLIKVVIGLVSAAVVGATWWVVAFFMRKRREEDVARKNMQVQTMKADVLNTQSAGLATISREMAKQASRQGAVELEATAKALDESKVVVIPSEQKQPGG